jgi:hypothetical protein
MSTEELFQWQSDLTNVTRDLKNKNKVSNRIEWLRKIIRATQIQRKEDESYLAMIEKEHSKLKSDVSAKLQ